ncbi:hypothetical protein [Thalassobius sp. I31.1]|uniref:hypothetical protein n=1 Tax=Thalassobius sp. I31.1 TaxID=2109912 RepID=UPI000D1B0953|nr:hypothetical protein [Thalassobius sp. I31.1]
MDIKTFISGLSLVASATAAYFAYQAGQAAENFDQSYRTDQMALQRFELSLPYFERLQQWESDHANALNACEIITQIAKTESADRRHVGGFLAVVLQSASMSGSPSQTVVTCEGMADLALQVRPDAPENIIQTPAGEDPKRRSSIALATYQKQNCNLAVDAAAAMRAHLGQRLAEANLDGTIVSGVAGNIDILQTPSGAHNVVVLNAFEGDGNLVNLRPYIQEVGEVSLVNLEAGNAGRVDRQHLRYLTGAYVLDTSGWETACGDQL